MESGVAEVRMGGKLFLDIEALSEYSGQGICKGMVLTRDTAARYREELRTWARSKKWRVTLDERADPSLSWDESNMLFLKF